MKKNSVKNMLENEFDDVDEKSEVEINISEKIGQTNKIAFGSGKGAIEINCDPEIKEILDKLNSLKIPDKIDEAKFQKEIFEKTMLDIVFNIRDTCYYFDSDRLQMNDVSFKNLLDLFLTKLESFSRAIFESRINTNPYYFYNMTCALGVIFNFLGENENLLNLSIKEKRLSIVKLIIGIQANILENHFIDRAVIAEYLKIVLDDFFMVCRNLESFLNTKDYCFLLKDLLVKLVKYLNDNPNFQNDRVEIINEFIDNLRRRVDQYGTLLYDNFVSMIKNIDYIENNYQITENALNDILVCQFDAEKYSSDNGYTTKKFDYIERKINQFIETAKNINTMTIHMERINVYVI